MDTKHSRIITHITEWLSEYAQSAGQRGFVVGVSGGIDSAVSSTLAARTGLPTLCVTMPIHQAPDQHSRGEAHAQKLASENTHTEAINIDLTHTFDTFRTTALQTTETELSELSLANSRARLRMTTLYYIAAAHRHLVVGTGNKIEDFGVGFYTKYGDGGVDLSPIADLTKTQVYTVGEALNVHPDILKAAPTDGLWEDNRTDESQMGATYAELEWAMSVDKASVDRSSLTERQLEVLKIYTSLNKANAHKMNPIPVCTIPEQWWA